ncbi:MAG TPA: hypothetical protein VFE33_04620 [Thermoanaerobaculia bacterium]|nr:hypothetical protein [Thermoanaerobaculia bacterium]
MFPVFTTSWALAILFHLSTPQGGGRSPTGLLLFGAATAVVFWPTCALSLLALCALQIVQFWYRLPRAQSSEYFKFICGLCLLSTYARLSLAQSTLQVEPEAWLRSALPLLRLAVSLLFLAAVLHKLNQDFLRTGVSFAPPFFDRVLEVFGFSSPPWIQHSSSYATILIESFLGIGLLFPATRLLAILVLLSFFFVVGLQGIAQFSSLMYASALWFFDDKVLGSTASYLGSASRSHLAFAVGCLLLFSSALLLRRGSMLLVPAVSLFSAYVVFALTRALLAGGASAVVSTPSFPLSPGQVALLLLFSLNELGPYIGYKDWPSFRMYSNLRTGLSGNHLFLRAWIFVPFFRGRREVAITAATKHLLYLDHGETGEEFYVPYSSLAAIARYHLRHPTPDLGDSLRQIEYDHQDTREAEGLESFGRKGRSWLDFLLPARFFYHFPASRRAGRGSRAAGRCHS